MIEYDTPQDAQIKWLREENKELQALVNTHLEAIDAAKHFLADMTHGCDFDKEMAVNLIKLLGDAYFKTPKQSLYEIKRSIKEETIEQCAVVAWLHFMDTCSSLGLAHGDWDYFCSAGSVRAEKEGNK